MGRPQATVADLAARAWPRFVGRWHEARLPWCDTCEQPALMTLAGWRHAAPGTGGTTATADADTTPTHTVTTDQWWAGHDTPTEQPLALVATTEDDPR